MDETRSTASSVDLRIVEMQSEIAELRKQNLQLQDLENRFKAIADTAPVLVWMSDTDKLCTYFNAGWLTFTGRTLEQECGNGWAEGVHPDDLDRCFEIYVRCFDKREPFSMQYRLKRHDGEYRWILDNGVPRYTLEGEFLGYIGSCVDIHVQKTFTDQLARQNRQLENKNKELRAFNYVATQDLQERLQKLINYSDLVSANFPELLSPVVNGYLQKLQEEAVRCEQMMSSLLQYTLLNEESNRRVHTDLTSLFKETLNIFADDISRLRATIDCGPLPALEVIPHRIKKVFANLLSNGLKFARPGVPPVISVRFELIPKGNVVYSSLQSYSYAQISFSDNGIGFDSNKQQVIFDVHTRSFGHANSGVALGLAIVKKIISEHEGEIYASSSGEGARFDIFLPLYK